MRVEYAPRFEYGRVGAYLTEHDGVVAATAGACRLELRADVPLTLTLVEPEIDLPFQPFVYDISVGVRRGEGALLASIQAAMDRHRPEIDQILSDYGVPRK